MKRPSTKIDMGESPASSPGFEKVDSGLLMKMMSKPHESPIPRARLARLYPISLRFRKQSLEKKFSVDNDRERFYTSCIYTIVVYTLLIGFFMIATPKYMKYHSTSDWPVFVRIIAFGLVCVYTLISILAVIYLRCKYGPEYRNLAGNPFGRYWEIVIALITGLFMTLMIITMGAIMESKIFWLLSHCKTHDLRDIISFPLSCGTNAPDEKVEYEELFTNWELKTAHGSSFILATCILLSLQQIDWIYCSCVVIWIYIVQCAVHILKAPKQDFRFYYGEMPDLEPMDTWLGIVSFHTAVALFGLTMLYQITSLRRRQYASLVAIDRVRRLEKQFALHQIGKQRKKIGELEESWRVSADEITCDALLATGGSGEVWRGRIHRQNEEERIVAIKKCIMGFDSTLYDDGTTNSKGSSLWEDGEIKLLMLIRHERLVSFLGAGEIGGYRFLVVELMTGGSIEKKLWDTPQSTLTKQTRLLWAHDVALGLDIVHSKNFVHRDLKTPNILFDATTLRAKIADFGLGKSLFNRRQKDNMPKHDDNDESKTKWSKCVMTGNAGSVLWMAPEVMSKFYGQNAEYGGGVDVYAYGIVLWELVSHLQPWHDISDIVETQVSASNLTDAIFSSVKKGLRPTVDDKMMGMMSPAYFRLMRACWDTDPSKRPPFSKIKSITGDLLKECRETEYVKRAKRWSLRKDIRHSVSSPPSSQRDTTGSNTTTSDCDEEKKSERNVSTSQKIHGMKESTTVAPLSVAMKSL